jgi:hypothetical protein
MAREKPNVWHCAQHYPIEVTSTVGARKRARCLGCGACGPERAGTEEAMVALRAEARYRGKLGA